MSLSDKEKENALNEVRILASIRNCNVVGYKEVFIDEQSNSLLYLLFYFIMIFNKLKHYNGIL